MRFLSVLSVLPERIEPVRTQLGIPDGVLNVLMPQIVLDRPSVVPIVGELEACAVPEHVRVDR